MARRGALVVAVALVAASSAVAQTTASSAAKEVEVKKVVFPDEATWKASGAEVLQRTQQAAAVAESASSSAEHAAGAATRLTVGIPNMASKVGPMEAATKKSLEQAVKAQQDAQALLVGLEEKAYVAAKKAAVKEVEQLETEGKAYLEELLKDMKVANLPVPDKATQAEAASTAAKPYVEASGKIQSVILQYNDLATQLAEQVNSMIKKAQDLANLAVQQQDEGKTALAEKNMLEAHRLLSLVPEKKARALKIRELVEHMNKALPSYKQAAQAAADQAAAAVVSALQVSAHVTSGGILRGAAA